ncbi:D-arabinono-1,4-lactone oxidase-domain-containing protein [Phascolomyces articulosus]|uniref:D-arabinono-1,4-lactone oxidase n=1 Tax=Phascolomyces articulosus TaxID=60185 RepID=A0AAD5K7G1_9FUNG|nr:D-arabinono-1,4-lactone oxidase-domain-containing protein [Phascolomyces articulosus]
MPRVRLNQLDSELRAIATEEYTFQNWAKTFQCTCEIMFEPCSEKQLIKIVQLAQKHNKPIKVFGSGHSPSDLACSRGFMINIDKMNGLLRVDKQDSTITVEAGMTLHQLHATLQEHGLAMSNLGSISDQTIAGVISTATHGTGAGFGCLSSMVLDMTLITANGELIQCSPHENPDLFSAARCSLGALGIITRVSLQVEPAFHLEAIQRPYKFDHVLSDWDDVVHSAEHVRVWWYPHTNDCVVWRANRTEKPIQHEASNWLMERGVGVHLYQFMLNAARYRPSVIPSITRFMFDKVHQRPTHVVDESYKVFMFDCLFPQYVNEWAIPWENSPQALKDLDEFINTSELKVHFPVEIRFVDEDDIWLSPSYKTKTCYIGVIMYRPYGNPVPYKKYWKAYEDIMRKHGGRPHWAKAHGQSAEQLNASYPRFRDFLNVREKVDPQGMFLNDYLKRHILLEKPLQSAAML